MHPKLGFRRQVAVFFSAGVLWLRRGRESEIRARAQSSRCAQALVVGTCRCTKRRDESVAGDRLTTAVQDLFMGRIPPRPKRGRPQRQRAPNSSAAVPRWPRQECTEPFWRASSDDETAVCLGADPLNRVLTSASGPLPAPGKRCVVEFRAFSAHMPERSRDWPTCARRHLARSPFSLSCPQGPPTPRKLNADPAHVCAAG